MSSAADGVRTDLGEARGHAAGEAFFLYIREPGGNRVEIYTGDTLIFEADWEPVRWLASGRPAVYWGSDLPQSMHTYATSPVDVPQTSDTGTIALNGGDLVN